MDKEEKQKTTRSRAEKFHPTLWIQGQKSYSLAGKNIVLGVTGSIGAVRVVELARELIRNGAEVHAVYSADIASEFLSRTGLGKEVIEAVAGCIRTHRFSAGEKPDSLEARILQDADRIDALGAVGIFRSVLSMPQ